MSLASTPSHKQESLFLASRRESEVAHRSTFAYTFAGDVIRASTLTRHESGLVCKVG